MVPLDIHSGLVRRELPVLIGATGATYVLIQDGVLGFADGLILMLGLAGLLFWMIYIGMTTHDGKDPMAAEYEAEIPTDLTLGQSLFWLMVGIVTVSAIGAIGLVLHSLGSVVSLWFYVPFLISVAILACLPELLSRR